MAIVTKFGPSGGSLGRLAFASGRANRPRAAAGRGTSRGRSRPTIRSSRREKEKPDTFLQVFPDGGSISQLDSGVRTGRGGRNQTIGDQSLLTDEERRTGTPSDAGNRIRRANNLTASERRRATEFQSRQETMNPNAGKTDQQLQNDFARQFETNTILNADGSRTGRKANGDYYEVSKAPEGGSISQKDATRLLKEVDADSSFDEVSLSQEERIKRAGDKFQAEQQLMNSVSPDTQEQFQPSQQVQQTLGVSSAGATGSGITFIDEAQAQAEVQAPEPLTAQAVSAKKAKPESGVEVSDDRIAKIRKGLSRAQRNVMNARITTAETDEERNKIVFEAASQVFINELEESGDPEKVKLAEELKSRESPALSALDTFLFEVQNAGIQ